jgi:hypothetical protein
MIRSSSPPKGDKRRPKVPSLLQEAPEITRTLKGHLKNGQLSYLRAAVLLASVRDRKLYTALHHPDMVSYARARLGLQQSLLHRYLQVHDWVLAAHPQWLGPKPRGFIPDLAAARELAWIEKRLTQEDLDARMRKDLEGLRDRALKGKLTRREFIEFRRRGREADWLLQSFLRRLRRAYQFGVRIEGLPPAALSALETALETMRRRIQGTVPVFP